MSDPRGFGLYAKLPVWAQNVACSLAGIRMRRQRYNRTFRDALGLLNESQWWPLERQQAYQDEQLAALIRHAYATVPYYREVFDGLKLKPDDVKTAADLPKLPILDKETVRRRFDDLLSKGWPAGRFLPGHTGGTTGKSLRLAYDVDTPPWQWAVTWRQRMRFGLEVSDPFIVFAGRSVVPLTTLRPPIWRRNWPMHQTYVSVHHLTRQNMAPLVEYLQRRQVPFYSGYPSALYLVAEYLLDKGIRLPHPPRIVVTASETVLPHQRKAIEAAFGADVADLYGTSEQCGTISECEKHGYHVDMEFGVVEFLPGPGLDGDTRRIICTGLRNPLLPLIRYDIGDLATLAPRPCPCGRQSPGVLRIDGRIESYIVTPDGRQLGRLDFLFKDSDQVQEAQLIQEDPGRLIMKVVKRTGYTADDEQQLMRVTRHYLGEAIEVDIQYVDQIPREANGKFRQIVSRVLQNRDSRTGGGK